MPRDVDTDQRLADIAAATIRVARSAGAHAVTIRSVARELGGSTTLVTNYVPSRAALILNALDRGDDRWSQERDELLAAAPPAERFAALIDWSLSSTTDDPVLRTLILEVIVNARFEPDMRTSLLRESRRFQDLLERVADESGYREPAQVAAIAYTMLRGSYIVSTEDPDRWDEDRLRAVIHAALAAHPRRTPVDGRTHEAPAE